MASPRGSVIPVIGLYDYRPITRITPMEKYDAENAKPGVDVLPLMWILLAELWDPSTGDMPITCLGPDEPV